MVEPCSGVVWSSGDTSVDSNTFGSEWVPMQCEFTPQRHKEYCAHNGTRPM